MSLDSEVTPRPLVVTPDVAGGEAETTRSSLLPVDLSRRGFLRGAALTGGGIVAATIAACAPAAAAPGWTYSPATSQAPVGPTPVPSAAATAAASAPVASESPAPSATPSANVPTGWTSHDVDARNVIRRYVGNLAPALAGIYGDAMAAKYAEILGVADNYPELTVKPSFAQVPQLVLNDAVAPLTPEIQDGVKVFKMTIDKIDQKIDEMKPPVAALGYNKQWPGPTIRANEGDKLRIEFTNNLDETTGVHFHGVEFDDVFQDGIPFINQKPIIPGETYAYEFTATSTGSLMYHSHHNATDQVGRGLLGAFVVEPKDEPYKVDREYVWISNDSLGGFTINGHGFPATVPVIAAAGETVRIRFMNEGIMMHPWHVHGYTMKVVARDGRPLGSAAFECDTLGVNPGERYDALITVEPPRDLGVPLPHPAARRVDQWHVRDGQLVDRGAEEGTRGCDPPDRPGVGRRARLLGIGIIVGLVATGCSGASEHDRWGSPVVTDAWVRLPSGPDQPAAAYFTITNPAAEPDALLGVTSPVASSGMLHQTSTDSSGMTGMAMVDRLDVPAGGTVKLEPGGYHVMMTGVTGVAVGASIELDLTFEHAGTIKVMAEARAG